jgi:hypothetical protein
MRWLKKIIGREETREQWLEKHPGKGAPKAAPPMTSPEEDALVRSHMEEELAEQRKRREES